ncbi:MAG: TonB-dependent receptor, partial [Lysobacteraceae bacterium]
MLRPAPLRVRAGRGSTTEYGRAVALDEVSYNYPSRVSARTYEPTLTVAWKSGIGTLTSRTSYGWRKFGIDFDFDGSYRDLGFSAGRTGSRTFQTQVDYAIDAIDRLDLVIGGLYYDDQMRPADPFRNSDPSGYTTITYGPGLSPLTGSTSNFDTTSYAIFADATYHLTDRLALNLGGRYSHDKRQAEEFIRNFVTNVQSLPVTKAVAEFSKFTPRASVRYELAPRTNVYASYSVGYRSGAFPPNIVSTPAQLVPVRPETLKAYEAGFKTAGRNLRAEVAAFYYDYRNYNVSIIAINPVTQSLTSIVGNAPKATIKGIEAQVAFTPIPETNITFAGSYLHARYGRFPNASGTGLNAMTNLNIGGQTQDWTGKQMSRAPDFSATASLDRTFDLFGGELVAAGTLAYSDSYVITNPSLFGPLAAPELRDKQRYRQGKTTFLNAQLNWTDPSGHYLVGVYGKNIFNEKFRATYSGSALYGDYGVAGQPVTYG